MRDIPGNDPPIASPVRDANRSRYAIAAGIAAWATLALLCVGHAWVVLAGMGGIADLTANTPMFRHDHPLYLHSAIVTRSFLRQSWTTAGYDPSFMAGYAKSVVFPASSALPEVVMALFPGGNPYRIYKMYVFLTVAIVPILIVVAGRLLRMGLVALNVALGLFLVYIWTDWPITYSSLGMVPYLLGVPLFLVTIALIGRYLERPSFRRWSVMVTVSSLSLLVHLTAAMIIVAPAMVAYGYAALRKPGLSRWAHAGFWGVAVCVLALNAFWWWPGVLLAGTKGESDFVFSHVDEAVLGRIAKIATEEAKIEPILVVLGVPGLVVLWCRGRVNALLVGGVLLMGFGWGYLAGASRALAFLQPGRHTFVFFSAACLSGGVLVEAALQRLAAHGRGVAIVAGVVIVGVFLAKFSDPVWESVQYRTNSRGLFLPSRTPRRLAVVERWIRRYMRPGQRLLYEESGFDIEGLSDPFAGGRYSGLLPSRYGIELLGGPYLHVSLNTNFTQFGEGKLFGREDWDRQWFVKYARIYRPSGIVCWTPRARLFCRSNPDLVRIDIDDGRLILGRIQGFGGDTVRGEAVVKAEPGRLKVRIMSTDVDGMVVLRYHSVPHLKAQPPVPIVPVFLAEDPVPFIGLRAGPQDQEVTLGLDVSP